MANILGVGIATLDIINTVNGYPAEDSEVRALAQRICRGGNCTNTLVVLSQLGHHCSWAGTLAKEPDAGHIVADLEQYNIDVQYCEIKSTGKVPTSYIMLNAQNGSRSIVHYRDLDELSVSAFKKIQLQNFDWIHFEGRNIENTLAMVKHLKHHCPDIPCSLEVEKQRDGIESLYEFFDVVIFSKAFCNVTGFNTTESFIKTIRQQYQLSTVIIPWGDSGAYASGSEHALLFEPAVSLAKVVDSLGAGDTFNAGIINALLNEKTLNDALQSANQIAAYKCTIEGFSLEHYGR